MKEDKINYLKGNKELLRLADEDYVDMLFLQSFFQSAVGFSKPIKFKNRYSKNRFEGEIDRYKHPKFFAIKNWSYKN